MSRLSAIKITPMISRWRWEGGAGARRDSPRFAEVVAPMPRMLTQGQGHFKRTRIWITGSRNLRVKPIGASQWNGWRRVPNDLAFYQVDH